MVAFLSLFLGVVSLCRAFLGAVNALHGGIHVECDAAEPFFCPHFFPKFGFDFGQFLAMSRGEEFENASEGGVIRKAFPVEKCPKGAVGGKDGHMGHVPDTRKNTHCEHDDRVRDLICGGISALYGYFSVKSFPESELFRELAQVYETRIAGEILFAEFDMEFLHHDGASEIGLNLEVYIIFSIICQQ